jgi:hypothetical protein
MENKDLYNNEMTMEEWFYGEKSNPKNDPIHNILINDEWHEYIDTIEKKAKLYDELMNTMKGSKALDNLLYEYEMTQIEH